MVTESQYFRGPPLHGETAFRRLKSPPHAVYNAGRQRGQDAFDIAKAMLLIYCFTHRTDFLTA